MEFAGNAQHALNDFPDAFSLRPATRKNASREQ